MRGLIGQKLGMTQVYDDKGQQIAVTAIKAGPCVVVQRKTREKDGYEAVQLGFGDQKEHRVSKPALARLKKVNSTPKRHLAEFRLDEGEEAKEGEAVGAGIFGETKYVDVTSITKGRGFQGVVRRHGMRGGPLTHGGHSKRRIGSVGQNAFPARINKGHRMPGHMGNVKATMQNLRVVAVRQDDNVLLVNGAVPGPNGAIVLVRKARKKGAKRESV